mmetsp:Transcript_47030/g.156731  ORF Transcript_47030/g.156731 Transcript_47030/m.156731 type:complete len:163 (+) Transcript_47030:54-542(+)
MHKSLLLLSLLSGCAALVVSPARASPAAASRCAAPTALAPVDASAVHSVASLVAEIVQADGERAYGAVDAPLWVLPVGAIAVIATALVPMCGCTLHICHAAASPAASPTTSPTATSAPALTWCSRLSQPALARRGGLQPAAGLRAGPLRHQGRNQPPTQVER